VQDTSLPLTRCLSAAAALLPTPLLQVHVFETTIRVLGGLLSGHMLLADDPGLAPGYDGLLLRLAGDLGDRLLAAFDTPSGLPGGHVHLQKVRVCAGGGGDGGFSKCSAAQELLDARQRCGCCGCTSPSCCLLHLGCAKCCCMTWGTGFWRHSTLLAGCRGGGHVHLQKVRGEGFVRCCVYIVC
jgi:hypothetical protein